MDKGVFITFEGVEGAGKSTQIELLRARIASTGREALATRAPGGTEIAERIREILKSRHESEDLPPETELMLFAACHSQMVGHLIKPALERGAAVLCDRFFDSTLAYQGYARGLPLGFVREVNSFSCRGLKPDVTLLLDLDPATGVARSHSRGGAAAVANDRFDSESMQFHKAVRAGFLDIAAKEPGRFRIVRADQPPEKVHDAIIKELGRELGVL